ncbi:MAG: hypothetical protein JOY80_09265, partial [Candidatus Dormibacteraeota bacterium]|nr:hypothetical protein [Candidatus Dormibacteraeota bacterium]
GSQQLIKAQIADINALKPSLAAQNPFLNLTVGSQPECGGNACGIDEVFTGTLLGNINYPNDQLTVTNNSDANNPVKGLNPELVTNEWDSMFSVPSSAPPDRALNITLSFHCNEISSTFINTPFGTLYKELLALLPVGTCS